MTRPGYKMTEIGEIPEEWSLLPLTMLATYINGMAFKPRDWKKRGIPIVRIENLNNPYAPFNYFDGPVDNRFLLDNGDILLSWSASLGVYLWNRGKAVLNQHIFKVVPNKIIKKYYLFWALHNSVENLSKVTHGSTMKHFQKGELERTKIALPPFPEQQKIAEILSTTDDAIQRVNDQIIKTKRLKKGLMQTLFTKGIGHTKFKMTDIGEIPEKWKVGNLTSVTENKNDIIAGPFGSNMKVSDYTEVGVPIIRLQNIAPNSFIYKDIKYIRAEKAEELAYHSFMSGDIVLAKLGNPIGVSCLVPSELSYGIVVADVVRIRVSAKKANKQFVVQSLNSPICLRQLKSAKIGSTRPRVNLPNVRNLRLIIPSLPEQQKIGEILSDIDSYIGSLEKYKGKLDSIKKGLMQDLLTGKVRVNNLKGVLNINGNAV